MAVVNPGRLEAGCVVGGVGVGVVVVKVWVLLFLLCSLRVPDCHPRSPPIEDPPLGLVARGTVSDCHSRWPEDQLSEGIL